MKRRAIRGVILALAATAMLAVPPITAAQTGTDTQAIAANANACEGYIGCLQRSMTSCRDPVGDGPCHSAYSMGYTCEGPIELRVHVENGTPERSSHFLGTGYETEFIGDITPDSDDVDPYVSSWECCDDTDFVDCMTL